MPWYPDWPYRIPITSQNAKVAEAITNAYIDLSEMPTEFWDNVKDGGGDIRITQSDGTTEVAREIVFCDTGTDTGEVWFDCTGIQTGSDVTWYIYYGNAAASDYAIDATYGAENVWETEDKLVLHLQDDFLDSTSNDNDATNVNTTDATGKIGDGQEGVGGGADQHMTVADSEDWNVGSGDFSISLWWYPDVDARMSLFAFQTDWRLGIDMGSVVARSPGLWASSNGSSWDMINADGGGNGVSAVQFATETWVKVDLVRDGNNWRSYYDGVADLSLTVAGTVKEKDEVMRIGLWGTGAYDYNGRIDEFRWTKGTARSANWITTEFNNQNDPGTYWSIGAEETIPAQQVMAI